VKNKGGHVSGPMLLCQTLSVALLWPLKKYSGHRKAIGWPR